jgi:uncharacterized protein (TIGR00290 family)
MPQTAQASLNERGEDMMPGAQSWKAAETRRSVVLSWSGGKDSALALHALGRTSDVRVEALLTTITRDLDRISMHGVRRSLLEAQAASLGLPLWLNVISKGAGNAEYEAGMADAFATCRARGIDTVAFGDLFLEDIRAYRDRLLAEHRMQPLYPVWRRDTDRLMREFLNQGFKTAVVCVDPKQLDPAFVGRVIDEQFLADLPPGVDPCGENGEFHTFVFDGPMFAEPVGFSFGEIVCRDGFWFCDLVPEA